jgi:hypothetical protein
VVVRHAVATPLTSVLIGRNGERIRNRWTGRLGVTLMRTLLRHGHLIGHDGTFDPALARADRLSARGRDHVYQLTPTGRVLLHGLGVDLPLTATTRYCVDWSEQQTALDRQVLRQAGAVYQFRHAALQGLLATWRSATEPAAIGDGNGGGPPDSVVSGPSAPANQPAKPVPGPSAADPVAGALADTISTAPAVAAWTAQPAS